jgi:micrococcal nuclease
LVLRLCLTILVLIGFIFNFPILLEAATLCKGAAACFSGNVTKVVDGDTLDVNGIRIRLSLINTPEIGMKNYTEAKDLALKLCPVGSMALVDQDDGQTRGSYGRMIGEVYCNFKAGVENLTLTKNLSEEELKSGLAEMLTKYCASSEFASELWAKKYGC